jgi:hypothetical protein
MLTGVTNAPLGPLIGVVGAIITSFHELLVKDLVRISSITPIKDVPFDTVAIT